MSRRIRADTGGDTHAGFQHTIDWGLVSTNTVRVSFDILARYCAARVDHSTTAIGEALCNHWFELSTIGNRNVIDALALLPCNSTFGNCLWMGFGSRHLVRTLSDSDQGTVCLALCSALSECFNEEVAAEVLYEMVKTVEASSHPRLSILQWKAIVKACAGALAQSNFSSFVEELIQDNPTFYSLGSDTESYQKANRSTCPSSKLIAMRCKASERYRKGNLAKLQWSAGMPLVGL